MRGSSIPLFDDLKKVRRSLSDNKMESNLVARPLGGRDSARLTLISVCPLSTVQDRSQTSQRRLVRASIRRRLHQLLDLRLVR